MKWLSIYFAFALGFVLVIKANNPAVANPQTVTSASSTSAVPKDVLEKLQKKYGGRNVGITKESEGFKIQFLESDKVTIVYLNEKDFSELRVEK